MFLRKFSVGLFAIFSVGIALYAFIFHGILSPAGIMELGARVAPSIRVAFQSEKPSIYLHALFSGIALLIAPFQIIPYFRGKSLKAHRWAGRIYFFSAMIGSVTGLIVATKASGGIAAQIGFGILAVLWFTTTLTGLIAILLKRLEIHRRAMFYSCSLCFSAVTIRAFIGIGMVISSGNFELVYPIATWLCFVPNIPIAELVLRYSHPKITFDENIEK